MKIANSKKRWWAVISLAAALVPMPASALDIRGFTTATDAACAADPVCAARRGGLSDIMTVYAPDGSIFQQIFAFGNEEENNVYYFDPRVILVDPTQEPFYTTLLEPDEVTISDTFGLANLGLPSLVLAFISDDNVFFPPPIPGLTFVEVADIPNPAPEPGSDDSRYLTIPYDATRYLAPQLRAAGYTATFRSDVPEPDTLALTALALATMQRFVRRRTAVPG